MFGLNAGAFLPVHQCFCHQLSLMSIPGLSTLVLMQADSLTAVCKASNKKTTKCYRSCSDTYLAFVCGDYLLYLLYLWHLGYDMPFTRAGERTEWIQCFLSFPDLGCDIKNKMFKIPLSGCEGHTQATSHQAYIGLSVSTRQNKAKGLRATEKKSL